MVSYFRTAVIGLIVSTAFGFLVVISWGAIGLPAIALLFVPLAILTGLIYCGLGLLFGVVYGWGMAASGSIKNLLFSIFRRRAVAG